MWLQARTGTVNFIFEEGGQAHKAGTANTWTVLSDRRLKSNIAARSGSLEKLLRLRSVTFDFKEERRGRGRQTGFIAQEVQEVYPEWVSTGPEGFLGIAFSGFEAESVQALRELRAEKDAQIARLEAEVQALKKTLAAEQARHAEEVTARLDAMEKRLAARLAPLATAGTR